MSLSESIIYLTGGQTMVKLFYTTLISVDLPQYEIFRTKVVISGLGSKGNNFLPCGIFPVKLLQIGEP